MDKKQYTGDITKRFLLLCDEVIREGHTRNKSTFAKSVGEYQQNLALMEKGTRSPTLEHIAAACKLYGYSANWVVLNLGEKKLKAQEQKPLDERVSFLESEVARITRVLKKK